MKVSVNKILRESENPLGGGEVQLDVLLERLLEHQLDVWDLWLRHQPHTTGPGLFLLWDFLGVRRQVSQLPAGPRCDGGDCQVHHQGAGGDVHRGAEVSHRVADPTEDSLRPGQAGQGRHCEADEQERVRGLLPPARGTSRQGRPPGGEEWQEGETWLSPDSWPTLYQTLAVAVSTVG